MSLVRLYLRVLKLLGSETRLGWFLAFANVALAAAQFAEPVLFGRIIDALAGVQNKTGVTTWDNLLPLLLAWAAFGIFTIACGVVVALYADRLAHRRRHVVLTDYFEHVLQLPLVLSRRRAFRPADEGACSPAPTRSGASGSSFFREHFAAFVSLLILLPLSLYPELAAGASADRAVRDVRRADRDRSAQDQRDADRGGAALFGSRGTRLRRARQCRAGAELCARRGGGLGLRNVVNRLLSRADAGAVVVGGGRGRDARLHHHHAACDLPRRHRRCCSRDWRRSARS